MLGVLFAGAFVMGSAEVLVVGLLDLIATDLNGSVPAAGALVTANALGLALGGPLLTLVTTGLDRRTLLLGPTPVLVLGNLLPALVAGYPLFMGAGRRVKWTRHSSGNDLPKHDAAPRIPHYRS